MPFPIWAPSAAAPTPTAFAGISCTLDDSWYFYTDEQIDELNGFVRESTSDEELKTRLESSSSVQDMYAASTDGLMTINVVFTNMGLLGGSTVTPPGCGRAVRRAGPRRAGELWLHGRDSPADHRGLLPVRRTFPPWPYPP